MARDVGSMGESEFEKLCSAAGLTPNTVRRDKKGWDSIVQFPMAFPDSLDLTPPSIKAFVQIKATDERKKKTQYITLLNLLSFVTDSSPCFLCQISFDGHDSAQRIYLMHVGEELIRNTLKKIRELQGTDGFQLNKRKLPIKFKKEHLLQAITGESLKLAIESHVPMGMGVYTQYKSQLTNSVGYEDGNALGTFTVKGENSIRALLDLSLGLVAGIDIEEFTLSEQRFGICSPQPIFRSESGKLLSEKVNPVGRARLKFSETPLGPGIFFDGNWYASPFNALVNEGERKFRVANQLIEVVVKLFKQTAIVSLMPNYTGEKLKLSDLKKVAELLRLFNNSPEELYVSIEIFTEALEREINNSSPSCIRGVLTPNDSFKAQAALAEAILDAHEVARSFRIEDDVLIDLDEFDANKTSIRAIHDCVIDNRQRWFKVQFGPDMDECERHRLEGAERVGCIATIGAMLGQYRLVCIFAIVGDNLTRDPEERLELLSLETDHHRHFVFQYADFPTEEQFEAEFDRIAEQLNAEGITAIRLK